MIAINAMVATRQFADAVRTAVAAGVDAVVSGAGLPLELPALTRAAGPPSPPLSPARAAKLIPKDLGPEIPDHRRLCGGGGPQVGGHLGFHEG